MRVTTLSEVRRESASASTLRLDLGGVPLDYRPGQYVTISPHQFESLGPAIREREAARGKKEGPGYFSLSSDALDPSAVEITVKARSSAAALLPHFLANEARAGLRIELAGPDGRYALPAAPPEGVAGILHLCAGSGVAPNRGMIRHALARGWPQRHLLVLQERAEEEVLFRSEWRDLLARHGDLFRMRTLLSSRSEYADPAIVREAMAGFIEAPSSMAFVCGPNAPRNGNSGFLDSWKRALHDALGFAAPRIVTEG